MAASPLPDDLAGYLFFLPSLELTSCLDVDRLLADSDPDRPDDQAPVVQEDAAPDRVAAKQILADPARRLAWWLTRPQTSRLSARRLLFVGRSAVRRLERARAILHDVHCRWRRHGAPASPEIEAALDREWAWVRRSEAVRQMVRERASSFGAADPSATGDRVLEAVGGELLVGVRLNGLLTAVRDGVIELARAYDAVRSLLGQTVEARYASSGIARSYALFLCGLQDTVSGVGGALPVIIPALLRSLPPNDATRDMLAHDAANAFYKASLLTATASETSRPRATWIKRVLEIRDAGPPNVTLNDVLSELYVLEGIDQANLHRLYTDAAESLVNALAWNPYNARAHKNLQAFQELLQTAERTFASEPHLKDRHPGLYGDIRKARRQMDALSEDGPPVRIRELVKEAHWHALAWRLDLDPMKPQDQHRIQLLALAIWTAWAEAEGDAGIEVAAVRRHAESLGASLSDSQWSRVEAAFTHTAPRSLDDLDALMEKEDLPSFQERLEATGPAQSPSRTERRHLPIGSTGLLWAGTSLDSAFKVAASIGLVMLAAGAMINGPANRLHQDRDEALSAVKAALAREDGDAIRHLAPAFLELTDADTDPRGKRVAEVLETLDERERIQRRNEAWGHVRDRLWSRDDDATYEAARRFVELARPGDPGVNRVRSAIANLDALRTREKLDTAWTVLETAARDGDARAELAAAFAFFGTAGAVEDTRARSALSHLDTSALAEVMRLGAAGNETDARQVLKRRDEVRTALRDPVVPDHGD